MYEELLKNPKKISPGSCCFSEVLFVHSVKLEKKKKPLRPPSISVTTSLFFFLRRPLINV
jgi:hypothetical protein